MVLLGCVAAAACDLPLDPTPSPGARLEVLYVFCGSWTTSSAVCTAQGRFSDGGLLTLTAEAAWRSSNASIATVDGGRVTFVGRGNVVITASYQGITAGSGLSTERPGQS
jgi:hypothetical protein